MSLKDWIDAMLGRPEPVASGDHVILDEAEQRLANRLSKLRGVERDEVLSEAYRRARLLDESDSYHRERT